jgi:hypothetical protein
VQQWFWMLYPETQPQPEEAAPLATAAIPRAKAAAVDPAGYRDWLSDQWIDDALPEQPLDDSHGFEGFSSTAPPLPPTSSPRAWERMPAYPVVDDSDATGFE